MTIVVMTIFIRVFVSTKYVMLSKNLKSGDPEKNGKK